MGGCPERRLVFLKIINLFLINEKASLTEKLLTNLGPPFSSPVAET